jgi:3-hydroxymyristoyl/3-hydroxydecanoyl-(acyl carrier protein) dehydratase
MSACETRHDMDHHFRAFSFVDRITSVRSGVRICGSYIIPSNLGAFPASLVAEAVGQLAAWAAIAGVDFERRPVAGLAGAIDLLAPVRPGQVLELAAELASLDADAVAYDGTAHADGIPVMRLEHCVGPMVAVADFDDPKAIRDRFALLCGSGATPGSFGGLPSLVLDRTNGEAGHSVRATFQVPLSAPLFADHFPRRAVFPGSLLMHLNLQLAAALATEMTLPARGGRWGLRTVLDVKLRAFIPPGESLDIEARLDELAENSATVAVDTRNGNRVVGSARVLLVPEEGP